MDIKTEYLNPNSDSLVRCTFFFFAMLHGLQDFLSLTRDGTDAHCSGSTDS